MLGRIIEQIARRREHPTRAATKARCARCGRDYQKPWPSHQGLCWWCATMEDAETDPYVDLGGGD